MAELLQHLLAVGQVRSHKLGSIHLDLLFDSPGGQARLGEGGGGGGKEGNCEPSDWVKGPQGNQGFTGTGTKTTSAFKDAGITVDQITSIKRKRKKMESLVSCSKGQSNHQIGKCYLSILFIFSLVKLVLFDMLFTHYHCYFHTFLLCVLQCLTFDNYSNWTGLYIEPKYNDGCMIGVAVYRWVDFKSKQYK